MWGDIAIAFLLAFITAFVITPYTIRIAKKSWCSRYAGRQKSK